MTHPSTERFHAVLKDIAALHGKKGQDYGVTADPFYNIRQSARDWNLPPWVAAKIRGGDKVRRMQAFVRKGRLENESLEDSLWDDAVYSVIALVLYLDEKEAMQPVTKVEDRPVD